MPDSNSDKTGTSKSSWGFLILYGSYFIELIYEFWPLFRSLDALAKHPIDFKGFALIGPIGAMGLLVLHLTGFGGLTALCMIAIKKQKSVAFQILSAGIFTGLGFILGSYLLFNNLAKVYDFLYKSMPEYFHLIDGLKILFPINSSLNNVSSVILFVFGFGSGMGFVTFLIWLFEVMISLRGWIMDEMHDLKYLFK